MCVCLQYSRGCLGRRPPRLHYIPAAKGIRAPHLRPAAGAVDLWEACLQRRRHKGLFELTHVSSSAVIIKNLQTGARTVVRSQSGAEIDKVRCTQQLLLESARGGGPIAAPGIAALCRCQAAAAHAAACLAA